MLQWRALFLLALGCASLLPAHSPTPKADDEKIYRLDDKVVPSLYEIHLSPEYVNDRIHGIKKFEGTVKIWATIAKDTKRILVHSDEKTIIEDVKVFKLNDGDVGNNDAPGNTDSTDATPAPDGKLEIGLIDSKPEDILEIPLLNNPIANDNTEIRIEIKYYRDFEPGALSGFFASTYTHGDSNEKATVLATQFEPTHARMAFPCFDEPKFKAKFDLTIDVTANVEAIANTPSTKTANVVTFERTPRMSTYLLAFVVYETASFKEVKENNAATYGRAEEIDAGKGTLSQSEVPLMLDILGEYTKVSYYGVASPENDSMGMEKIDQAAVPDFTGGMENWGLVTYSERALLFPNGGSTASKKSISQVIARELAHQWFGNWVTTEWWSTIWLNEGFADFFEYYVMEKRYPNWKMDERMVLDEQMPAFDADSSTDSPPLTFPSIETPQQISDHFGTITYSKGGSILRQIKSVLGASEFQAAIRAYLKEKAFDSATPDDIFKHFVAKNDVEKTLLPDAEFEKMLKTWTEMPGYPIITVERNGNKIKVKQDRYLLPGNAPSTNIYDVYLTWVTDKDYSPTEPLRPQKWLREANDEIVFESEWGWIILNPHQGGYYRVDYHEDLWANLSKALSNHETMTQISAIDRAALVNNALSLARERSDRGMTYEKVFEFLNFLRHDTDFEPWAALRSSIAHVERLVGGTTAYRIFINNLMGAAFHEFENFEVTDAEDSSDDNVRKTHRINILTLACTSKREFCLDETANQLREYLTENANTSKPVHADLQSVVYCYGLQKASDLWDRLWDEYVASLKDMARRQLIASALGCVTGEDNLKKYLDKSLGQEIPERERYLVFSAAYANLDGGPQAALKFLDNNKIPKLSEAYGANRVTSLLTGLAQRLTADSDIEKFKAVIGDDYPDATAAIQANELWMKTNQNAVLSGLARANGAATTIALAHRFPTFFGLPPPFRKKVTHRPLFRKKTHRLPFLKSIM